MNEATLVLEAPEPTRTAPEPEVVAGRYRLQGVIGAGGMAEVHLAVDELTGVRVALKRVPALTTHAELRVRRELAALRFLRVPGVVRLLDDGWDDHGRFIVMEHLEGEALFGRPLSWDEARGPLLELLDTLARVHALGIIHRDLKPENVLLVDGHPVVLDFGIALGPALAERGLGDRACTPSYASPQQQLGAPAEVRDDLYALGRMLEAVEDAPDAVLALRARLVADDPALRPASAEEVLLALGGSALSERLVPVLARLPDRPLHEVDLRALFHGPSAFLHIPEDAARFLWTRTGGDRETIGKELQAWLRRGFANIEGERLRLRREELERLQLTADLDVESLYAEAAARAEHLTEEGRLSGAQAWCELALVAARARHDREAVHALLELLTELALASENEAGIGLALYEVERSGGSSDLQALLHARRALLQKRRGEALRILGEARVYGRPRLEIWDARCRVLAAEPQARAAVLDGLEEWAANDELRKAKLAGWRGKLAYEQGRFEEAFDLHMRAAVHKSRLDEVLATRENAALAAVEFSPELARLTAEEVARQAAVHRLPVREALATGIARGAAYRTGQCGAPRPDLLEAAEQVGLTWPNLGGFGLTEAAIAWRCGETLAAQTLATRAATAFGAAGWVGAEALALALACATGAGIAAVHTENVVNVGRSLSDPRLGIQILGLMACAVPALAPQLLGDLRRQVSWLPHRALGDRLEVLSPSEALALIEENPEDGL